MEYKIAFVIPYFGTFNNYFELFLQSCKYNPSIDWYVFTDDKGNYNYPENVIVNYITFSELKNKIQSIYDFNILLNTPYDLCDFKVAYGEIFSDYLQKYDYWGFCDCDLIFGDIRKFIKNDILEKYNKILLRGHCTLFKNTSYINSLYKNPIDGEERYKTVFTVPGANHFDEGLPEQVKGINRIFKDSNIEMYDEYIFADLAVDKFAFIQADFSKDEEEMNISENSVFAWENGKLFRYYILNNKINKQEFMYIHLQKRKMKNLIINKQLDKFIIRSNKFCGFHEITYEYLSHSNKDKIYFSRIMELWKRRFQKVLNLVKIINI